MVLKHSIRLAAALIASALAATATAQDYTFIDLGMLGGANSSNAVDINNRGEVAGNSSLGVTLWRGVTATSLGIGLAWGINNSGHVVGTSLSYATVWDGSTTEYLTNLNGLAGGRGYGINDAGQVVGASAIDPLSDISRPTLWNNSTPTNLLEPQYRQPSVAAANAINNSGFVAGGSYHYGPQLGIASACFGSYGGQQAMVWGGGVTSFLDTPTNGCSQAMDINDRGQVVGGSGNDGSTHATVWNGTTATDLGTLGGRHSFAYGVNNNGLVVGVSQYEDFSRYHATLWDGTSVIDLNQFLNPDYSNDGWYLYAARAINDHGWIVGDARNANTGETRAYMLAIASPAPEPETYAMMLAGVILLGATIKRRNATFR